MPHVSGGGSLGGGGFNANNIGNVIHGTKYYYGDSGNRIEDPNDGSDRYLGKATLAKAKKAFVRSMVITAVLAIVLTVFLMIAFPLSAEKLAASENAKPLICDNADIIANEEKLLETLNEYHTLTGITPVIYTVYEEEWKTGDTSNFSEYAMEKYSDTASDETYFVIVYSVPKDEAGAAANGGIKNVTNKIRTVQGDLTYPILRAPTQWKFNGVLKFNSLTGANPGDALEKAFRFATGNAKNKLDHSAGSKILTLLDNTPLMIAWIVFLVIFIVIIRKYVKERKAGCEQLRSDKRIT